MEQISSYEREPQAHIPEIIDYEVELKFTSPESESTVSDYLSAGLSINEQYEAITGKKISLDDNPGIDYLIEKCGLGQLYEWFRAKSPWEKLAALYRPDTATIDDEPVSPELAQFFSNQDIGEGLQERAYVQMQLLINKCYAFAEKNGKSTPFRILSAACGDGYYPILAAGFLQDQGYAVEIDFLDKDPSAIEEVKKHIEKSELKNVTASTGDLLTRTGIMINDTGEEPHPLDKKYHLIDTTGFAGLYLSDLHLQALVTNLSNNHLENNGTLMLDCISEIPFMMDVLTNLVSWPGLIPRTKYDLESSNDGGYTDSIDSHTILDTIASFETDLICDGIHRPPHEVFTHYTYTKKSA